MIEKRAFHRVPFNTTAILGSSNSVFIGKVKNISYGGAMVKLKDTTTAPIGSHLWLSIHVPKISLEMHLATEVVYGDASEIGLRFLDVDKDTHTTLFNLMASIEQGKHAHDKNQ